VRKRITFAGADPRARLIASFVANALLAIIVAALLMTVTVLLSPWLTDEQLPVAYLVVMVLLALLIVPIRRQVRTFINHLTYRDWQNGEELLRDMNGALSRTLEPEALHTLIVDDLAQRLLLTSATLWMLQPPEERVFVPLGTEQSPDATLLANGASANRVRQAQSYLLLDPATDADWAKPFQAQGITLIIPMLIGQQLVGFLGCGAPLQGRTYPPRVVKLLITLAPAIASALQNTRAYATIAQLNQQLRTLDQLKAEFIEHVGHELRTPLTFLSLTSQILTSNGTLTPLLANALESGVLRLQSLIERVLLFEHNTASTFPKQHGKGIAVDELLDELLDDYQLAGQIKGLQLVAEAPPGLLVWGNRAQVRRALSEVLDNAIRYSKRGQIRLTASYQDGLAYISITDQGPGIPADERDQLFSPFFRGRLTRALSETPGTGLGLSIAQRDIEAQGGRIWLEQSSPHGSTICVALPATGQSESQGLSRAVGG
jgi:signal transduction histidine kinase